MGKKIEVKLIWIQPDYTPFHGCFLCGCIYILSGCHILIENSAIFITKCNEFSGRYLLQFLKKKQEKFSKQQKCYTTSLRILSHNRISFFQKLISTSVSNTKTQLFIETEIKMTKEKKVFCSKKLIFLFFIPSLLTEKNREIKRVLNDFAVTYQKIFPSPQFGRKIWRSSKVDVSALKSSMQVHLETILFLKKEGKRLFQSIFV